MNQNFIFIDVDIRIKQPNRHNCELQTNYEQIKNSFIYYIK